MKRNETKLPFDLAEWPFGVAASNLSDQIPKVWPW
jgi:hypothetical protein